MTDIATKYQYEKDVLVDRVNVTEEVKDVIFDVLSLSRHFDTTNDLQAIRRAKDELKSLIEKDTTKDKTLHKIHWLGSKDINTGNTVLTADEWEYLQSHRGE